MLGFPRASRMLHASEFASTLKTRPAARSTFLVLNHKRASSDERARLGLIVPKRFLKQSVSRNAVKRVLREGFRRNQHRLAPGMYAFRVHANPGALSLTQLKQLVFQESERIFRRLASS